MTDVDRGRETAPETGAEESAEPVDEHRRRTTAGLRGLGLALLAAQLDRSIPILHRSGVDRFLFYQEDI